MTQIVSLSCLVVAATLLSLAFGQACNFPGATPIPIWPTDCMSYSLHRMVFLCQVAAHTRRFSPNRSWWSRKWLVRSWILLPELGSYKYEHVDIRLSC